MTQATFDLKRVRKSERLRKDRILIAGTDGVGKTTFGADTPDPIFICAEDGLGAIVVDTLPEQPKTWPEVRGWLDSLSRGGHPHKTLVVDTLSWLEPLIWDHCCRTNGWKSIDEPAYGAGLKAALNHWRDFVALLDGCNRPDGGDMEVVLLCHTIIRNFKNPAGEDYARYELAINEKAAALLRQWADTVGFAIQQETYDKGKRDVMQTRVLHTVRSAGWDASTRWDIPAEIDLQYSVYASLRDGAAALPWDDLVSTVRELIAHLGEDHPAYEKAKADVEDLIARKKPRLLNKRAERLTQLVEELEEEDES